MKTVHYPRGKPRSQVVLLATLLPRLVFPKENPSVSFPPAASQTPGRGVGRVVWDGVSGGSFGPRVEESKVDPTSKRHKPRVRPGFFDPLTVVPCEMSCGKDRSDPRLVPVHGGSFPGTTDGGTGGPEWCVKGAVQTGPRETVRVRVGDLFGHTPGTTPARLSSVALPPNE